MRSLPWLSKPARTHCRRPCNRNADGWETCSCGAGPSSSRAPPFVLGLVLLHPNLSGVIGPAFGRILARSTLGRSILRPLLRTEVGEIANRRAWHNTDKLTSEVLELYKTPLRVEGWDAALIETTRQRKDSCQGDLAAYCNSVQPIPTLVATGAFEVPRYSRAGARMRGCGRLKLPCGSCLSPGLRGNAWADALWGCRAVQASTTASCRHARRSRWPRTCRTRGWRCCTTVATSRTRRRPALCWSSWCRSAARCCATRPS